MDLVQQSLAGHSFFRGLDDRQIEEITRLATVVKLDRGQVLALESEPGSAVYMIISGRLRAFKMSAQGREQVVSALEPGQAFYLVPVLDGGPLPTTTQALTRATVLRISRQDFLALMERFPSVALHVAIDLARRLRQITDLVEDLALRTVPQRLARLLVETARAPTGHRLTQREMAARLGTVREVIARTLSQFEERGWIRLQRGVIEIIDVQALETLAEQ
jgi:CRP/FNR family cyclic AMP-dependent transcriptional regulator